MTPPPPPPPPRTLAGTGTVPTAAPRTPTVFAAQLRSEWAKLWTVRSTPWALIVTVVIGIGVSALATAEVHAHWATMPPPQRAGFDPTQVSLTAAYFCQLVLGVLGVLVMSAEYGTGTIRATLAGTPRRPIVVGAKVAVFGAVAVVVGEVVTFLSFLIGQALLAPTAPHATLATPGALRAVVGTGLYLCVTALLGLGLATLLRHTAGAISAYVGIILVVPIIVAALPASLQADVNRFLPLNIGNTFIQAYPGPHLFAPWTGFAVLAAYVAGVFAVATVLLVRRDA
jgi:ABC-2 type transport system permease protein